MSHTENLESEYLGIPIVEFVETWGITIGHGELQGAPQIRDESEY